MLKGLESCISISVVHPTWQKTKPNDPNDTHHGWMFCEPSSTVFLSSPSGMGKIPALAGSTIDSVNGCQFVRDLYELSYDERGKYSVPVLWDKKTNCIVNNESSEIVRMFTKVFDEFATGPMKDLDLYPEHLRAEIDAVNDWVYPDINDGVYKCGFAKSQEAYDEASANLFNALDRFESVLSQSRYLVGNTFTEADLRAFMTLVRFDEVYVVYFKTNCKWISQYPNIHNYCRELYQMPGMADSINMDHIKTHYFTLVHCNIIMTHSFQSLGANFLFYFQIADLIQL
jgi:putative glutathione S-transferase